MSFQSEWEVLLWSAILSCSAALIVMIYNTVKCCKVLHETTPISGCRQASTEGGTLTQEAESQQFVRLDEAPPPSYEQLYPSWPPVMLMIPVVHGQLLQQDLMHQREAMLSQVQHVTEPPRQSADGVNYFDMLGM